MNTQLIPQFETLTVNKGYGEQEDFFRLINFAGDEIQLQKLPFQKNQPLPDHLTCRVKRGYNGEIYYTHNVPQYVKNFYGADHQAGKDFEFTIERVPYNSGDPYLLLDSNGIQFRLYFRGTKLSRGQNVRCRFNRMDNTGFGLILSEQAMALPMLHRYDIGKAIPMDRGTWALLWTMLQKAPFLAEANREFVHNQASWVLTMLRAVNANITDVFVRTNLKRRGRLLARALHVLDRLALHLIEGSSFLRGVPAEQRHQLQDEITSIAESLSPYRQALKLIHEGKEVVFIQDLLSKLEKSGFLYHPTNQFAILMLIFRKQPERVGEMFGRIYDVLMEWSLDNWLNEPFRSAFVEQFELYINEMRRTIDVCPQADTAQEKARVENMLKALALQQCIADSNTFASYSRNRSLYYRYISLLRPSSADILIDKAFRALHGQFNEKDITYGHIKDPALLMTQAAVPEVARRAAPSVRRFHGANCDVELHDHQLTVRSHAEASTTGGNLLPNGMIGWLSPEIFVPGIKRLTQSTIKKIKSHEEFWRDITQGLTEVKQSEPEMHLEPIAPSVGDDVLIVIDEVIPDPIGNNPTFMCHIDDENYVGSGYFKRSALVGYYLKNVDRNAILGNNGQPVHLVARVIGTDGDNFIFDLRNTLHEWIDRNLHAGMEINAVIASHNPQTDDYSAISELGIGMLLRANDDLASELTLGPTTVVRVMITQTSDHERVRGEIIGLADPNYRLGKDRAIGTLLRNLDYVDDIIDEHHDGDEDELLSRDDLREIIELYRMKAVRCDEVFAAYDYLRMGCLLAEIIGDHNLAAELGLHASLLQMHVDFADNRRVDVDKLEAIRPRIAPGTLAERIFRRMELVSWLGNLERNQDLWHQAEHPDSELEGKFARMVLSYNMLVASVLQENDYARRIKDDICALLKVNAERQTLKYYGCESQYCEFKSSMVFCANDGIKRTPEESHQRQQFEIMHIIAGFMNTTGGKLYIGVNDLHYERGLDEDFNYLRLPKSSDLLKRMDELLNYLTMRVAATFGRQLSTLVHIAVDEESSKGVLIVTVNPSKVPVYLQDTIYVRLSTSTLPITDRTEIENFINSRAQAYDDMIKMHANDNAGSEHSALEIKEMINEAEQAEAVDSTDTESGSNDNTYAAPADVEEAEDISIVDTLLPSTDETRIATSLWRKNALHDVGQNDFVVPERYLYFMGDNHYSMNKEDYWTDQDENCRLALAVLQSELDGYLILAYEGEQLIKVPMSQLMERAENRNHRYWSDARLLWVAVAHDSDAVLSVHADSAGGLHYRATPVNEIAKGSMTNAPTRIMSVGVDKTIGYELVAGRNLPAFTKALPSNMHSRQIGTTLRTRLGMPDVNDKMRELLNSCGM